MADYNSSLPIRTENSGDVIAKIADASTPSQQLAVNADGSVNITDNGGSITVDGSVTVSATDLDIRDLSYTQDSVEVRQATRANLNANATIQVGGTDVANGNPVPVSDAGGSLTVDANNLDIRDLVFATDKVDVSGSSVTVSATDLDIRNLSASQDNVAISDGTDTLAVNADGSINVVTTNPTGIKDYSTASAIASGATSNHNYTTAAAFKLTRVDASASGKMKIEIQIETGAATNTFNTVEVQFNSTATPNMGAIFYPPLDVASGARVRVIRTNKDNQSMDVYSTIKGYDA